jgi:hypothetical protein
VATATALRPAQLVTAKVELDIRKGGMLSTLYTKVPDFLIFVL